MKNTDTHQKATLPPAGHKAKYTTSHRKEGKCFFDSYQIISLADTPWRDGAMPSRVSVRLYGTGAQNTACMWINSGDTHLNASGKAGGYGYHRQSAALQEAFDNAGITLSRRIDGVGTSAMEEAMLALAKALKIKRPALVRSYQ